MLKSRLDLTDQDVPEAEVEDVKQYEQPDEEGDMGEAVMEEEEKIVVFTPRPLVKTEVCSRLSLLGKTAEGDGYTYLKATLTEMNLTDLTMLKSYKHLQFINVSNNNLELDALQVLTELPFLVLIHADNNALRSAALKRMKYLQVIIMNHNQITSVEDVYQPELCTLEVGYNRIQRVSFINRMPHIKVLDFRYNLIQDIAGFDFPNLDSLYLAGNKITSLVGLEKLVNLRILHVRNNPIKLLYGFEESLVKLQYINLRNCKVTTLRQVKKLKVLKALDTLMMKGCPYMGGTGEESPETVQEEEDAEIRVEVLATLPRLKRINKVLVTPEERAEAKDLITQWLEKSEKEEEEAEDEQNEEQSNVED